MRATAKSLGLYLCVAALAAAQDARTIVEEAQRRAEASATRYEGLLRVVDTKGRTTEKGWRFERLHSPGASRVVIRFTSPPDVKGVALLIVNYPDRQADQWLWTPAIQRERRITLQDRSTRFFGTDFSYEDMEERRVGQYDYRSLGEETLGGELCWRIEARPKKPGASQYTSARLWIRKQSYALARIDNYTGDRVARRLQCGAVENVQGIWTARLLDMTDFARGGHTTIRIDKLAYNLAMRPEDFTLQALRLGL